jgi:hypothetical protein
METLLNQQKESTPKSPYNLALGHFGTHGKLVMHGHVAQPYTFADGTLTDAMHTLVNRIRTADPRVTKDIEVMLKDTRMGFEVVVNHDRLGHSIRYAAEPSLDNDILRYESRIEFCSAHHLPQEHTLPAGSKAAYRGLGKKLVRDMEHYLLG